jgi:hypothetical protein
MSTVAVLGDLRLGARAAAKRQDALAATIDGKILEPDIGGGVLNESRPVVQRLVASTGESELAVNPNRIGVVRVRAILVQNRAILNGGRSTGGNTTLRVAAVKGKLIIYNRVLCPEFGGKIRSSRGHLGDCGKRCSGEQDEGYRPEK